MNGLVLRRWMARTGRPSSVTFSPLAGLRLLSNDGSPLDKSFFSPTLLNRAASRGAAKLNVVLDALHKGKFDPRYEFAAGMTVKEHLQARRCQEALTSAARFGDLDVVRQLVESGVDIESTTKDGTTTLMCGIQSGKTALVQYLLEKGARVAVINNRGQTPRSLASHHLQDGEAMQTIEALEAAQASNLAFPDACALFRRSADFAAFCQSSSTADIPHADPRFFAPLPEDIQAQNGLPMNKIMPRAVDLVDPETRKLKLQQRLLEIHREEEAHRQRMQEQRERRQQQQAESQLRQEFRNEIPRLRQAGLICSTSTLRPSATINPAAKATRLAGCVMEHKTTPQGVELTLAPVLRAWNEHPWPDPSFSRDGSVVVRVDAAILPALSPKARDAFLSFLTPGRLVEVHGQVLAGASSPTTQPFHLTIAAKSIAAFSYTAHADSLIARMVSSSHATLVDLESNRQPPMLPAICGNRQTRFVLHVDSNASIDCLASTVHQMVHLASQPTESPLAYQPWVVGVDTKHRSSFYDAPDYSSEYVEEGEEEEEEEEEDEDEEEMVELVEAEGEEDLDDEEEEESRHPSSLPASRVFAATQYLQIASRMGIFVIDMPCMNSSTISPEARKKLFESLQQLFTCRHIYKVGVDVQSMLQRMADSFGQKDPEFLQWTRVVDLVHMHQLLNQNVGFQPSTLSELFYHHFERSIDDMVNLSTPWHVRPIEEDAIEFAGLCAGAQVKLYDHFVTRLLSQHADVEQLLRQHNVVADIHLTPSPNQQQ